MKARSQRMKIVVEMAKRDEDAAITAFQQAQKALAAEQKKLSDLNQYYSGYENYFSSNQQNLRASDFQNARLFLQQLSDAKKSQQFQINKIEKLLEEKQNTWHVSHLKHKSLMDLVERMRREESLQLSKKEQQIVDEWVNQKNSDNNT